METITEQPTVNGDNIQPIVIPIVEPSTPPDELSQVVQRVNTLSVEITNQETLSKKHGKESLELAIQSGELLCKCKELIRTQKLGIGWTTWFPENIKGYDIRMAQYYIKLCKYKRNNVSFFDDCFSIRDGLEKIQRVENPVVSPTIETTEEKEPAVDDKKKWKEPKLKPLTPHQLEEQYPELYYKYRKLSKMYWTTQVNAIFTTPVAGYEIGSWKIDNWNIQQQELAGVEPDTRAQFSKLIDFIKFTDSPYLTEYDWLEMKSSVVLITTLKQITVQNKSNDVYTYTLYDTFREEYDELKAKVLRLVHHEEEPEEKPIVEVEPVSG